MHFVDATALHGAAATADAGKNSWHGLSSGTEVVAHYTKRAGRDTAAEVDRVAEGGLKAARGTIKDIDRGTKTMVVKTADSTEETFKLTGRPQKTGGRESPKGTKKGSKVVVYSTEDAGKKVAHFFEGV